MNKELFLGYVEMAGLTLVMAAACMWMVPEMSLRTAAGVVMVVATVLLALGRLLPKPFYQNYLSHDPRNLTLRRLYHQLGCGCSADADASRLLLRFVGGTLIMDAPICLLCGGRSIYRISHSEGRKGLK